MPNTFQVDVVSPEATVWSGEAVFVLAKTPDGELGIMANHEPLMGALSTGAVIVEDVSGNRTTIGVHGGFLQVLNNQVTLITDRGRRSPRVVEKRARTSQRGWQPKTAHDSARVLANSSTASGNPSPIAEAMTGKNTAESIPTLSARRVT